MTDGECPIEAVEKALALAREIEVRDIPADFDPSDASWRHIVATVAKRFSNHGALAHRLDQMLLRARTALCHDCGFESEEGATHPCEGCRVRWLAGYRLWEAVLEAAEAAYQRWLALNALRRASGEGA